MKEGKVLGFLFDIDSLVISYFLYFCFTWDKNAYLSHPGLFLGLILPQMKLSLFVLCLTKEADDGTHEKLNRF